MNFFKITLFVCLIQLSACSSRDIKVSNPKKLIPWFPRSKAKICGETMSENKICSCLARDFEPLKSTCTLLQRLNGLSLIRVTLTSEDAEDGGAIMFYLAVKYKKGWKFVAASENCASYRYLSCSVNKAQLSIAHEDKKRKVIRFVWESSGSDIRPTGPVYDSYDRRTTLCVLPKSEKDPVYCTKELAVSRKDRTYQREESPGEFIVREVLKLDVKRSGEVDIRIVKKNPKSEVETRPGLYRLW